MVDFLGSRPFLLVGRVGIGVGNVSSYVRSNRMDCLVGETNASDRRLPISEKALPKKLQGSVIAQYRYYKGKRLGPYWFRVWREYGRVHKRYVRAADVEFVRAACAKHRQEWKEEIVLHKHIARSLSDFKFILRLAMRGERQQTTQADLARVNRIQEKGIGNS